jgi:hypothetical protein
MFDDWLLIIKMINKGKPKVIVDPVEEAKRTNRSF